MQEMKEHMEVKSKNMCGFNKGIWVEKYEKEFETIKEYSYILVYIVNKLRLLGKKFTNSKIIEKNCLLGRLKDMNHL